MAPTAFFRSEEYYVAFFTSDGCDSGRHLGAKHAISGVPQADGSRKNAIWTRGRDEGVDTSGTPG